MSANLLEVGLLIGANSLINFSPNSNIGGIQVDTTLEELYEDALEVTDHPVERGAQITDHSFKRPMELVLTCGWSNSSFSGLFNVANGLLDQFGSSFTIPGNLPFVGGNPSGNNTGMFSGGYMVASDYISSMYSQLLQLQESRQVMKVVSGLRVYDNMLITALRVKRDEKLRYALMVTCFLRQVILVDTQQTTVPSQSSQSNPASTADTVNAGAQQTQVATPSAGGSYPVLQ